MFEQDQQGVVDRYLSGELNEKQFKDSCRLWENYTTDYKPLLDFAKDKKLNDLLVAIILRIRPFFENEKLAQERQKVSYFATSNLICVRGKITKFEIIKF